MFNYNKNTKKIDETILRPLSNRINMRVLTYKLIGIESFLLIHLDMLTVVTIVKVKMIRYV